MNEIKTKQNKTQQIIKQKTKTKQNKNKTKNKKQTKNKTKTENKKEIQKTRHKSLSLHFMFTKRLQALQSKDVLGVQIIITILRF